VDEVVDRYGELCQRARSQSGLGEHLKCHADLIGYAPTGYLWITQEVAQRLITEYGATITIDIRTDTASSFSKVYGIVDKIFTGQSGVVSSGFLDQHPIGLSLDFEPQVIGGMGVSAYWTNKICNRHRELMTNRGHEPKDLVCFLYEFGNPPMMFDGENLEPYIFPILMSIAAEELVDAKLRAEGKDPSKTPDEVKEAMALEYKESWVDNIAAEYTNTDYTGCMFFRAGYLAEYSSKDKFTFIQALDAFANKCDVYSFQ